MKNVFTVLFAILLLGTINCALGESGPTEVIKKIQNIATMHHCIVGVSAIYIETNNTVAVNENAPFFMASTVKVPIALTLLSRVDKNKENLNRIIAFNQNHAVPGSGNLYIELSHHPEMHKMSLRQLLRLMLIVSDNTATDLLLREVNGPQAVANQLKLLGFKQISVTRSIYDLYLSSSGLTYYSQELHKIQNLNKAIRKVTPQKKVQAWKQFENDKRDTATAKEMSLLLVKLYKGNLISPRSTQLLLEIMSECQTGKNRIKGLLPPCVQVAHKTGTWSLYADNFLKYPGSKQLYRFANDIGIITLPAEKGHIAIAIYVKSKAAANCNREATIARISREIYSYFLKSA